jgi:hypothetical protein
MAVVVARPGNLMETSIVSEVLSALEALKDYGQPGFWILVSILIVLALVIAAAVYQRIVIKRSQTPPKATQFEAIAADLRKRTCCCFCSFSFSSRFLRPSS